MGRLRTNANKLAISSAVALLFASALTQCMSADDLGVPLRVACPTSVKVGEVGALLATTTLAATYDHKWQCTSVGSDYKLIAPDKSEVAGTPTQETNKTLPASHSGDYRTSRIELVATSTGTVACRVFVEGEVARCTIDVTGAAPVDAAPAVDAAPDGPCDPIVDFSGTWHSVYKCTSSTGALDEGEFDLTIAQTGNSASYSDSQKSYTGTVCKNVWTFSGSRTVEGGVETEDGTLTLTSPTTADRKSTWKGPTAKGDCEDKLTRR